MKANNRFEAVHEAVMQLDLSPIKGKLMHAASGEGWSLEKASAVEVEYRRFLCLVAAFPEESIAPVVDVDTFWHYHILDTMKYAADCQQAFGYFVHHYPYVGLHGEDDEQSRLDGGERTRRLYAQMFGEAAARPAADSAELAGQADRAVADCGKAATAWCASPGEKLSVQAAYAAAWCASPGAKAGATAWCASPGDKAGVQAGNEAAWCASPGAQHIAAMHGGASAWCASPGAKDAATAS